MKYKYYALTIIHLGGKTFKSGHLLPKGRDYQGLYDNGMVSRQKVKDESKEVNTVASPIEIKVKHKRYGKRQNKSN